MRNSGMFSEGKLALVLLAVMSAGQLTPALAGQKPSPPRTGDATSNGHRFELTIDNIMRGPELVGYEPRGVRWSADSRRIFFQWKQAGDSREKDPDTYVVDRVGSGLRKLSDEEAKNAPPLGGDHARDKKSTVFVEDGDLFLYDEASGQRRRLTATTDVEANPHFIQDQRHVYFTQGGNLFVMSLEGGSLIQMTDIRTPGSSLPQTPAGGGLGFSGGGQARRDSAQQQKGTESQEYIKKEERDLIDVVKRRAERREEEEAKRKRENPRKPFQLQPRQSVTALQLSPDQKHVIASIAEAGEGAKNTIVQNYVTESAYSEDIPSRNKVGDVQGRLRLAVINVETSEVTWVDHGQKQTSAPAASKDEDAAETTREGKNKDEQKEDQSGEPRRRANGPRERDVQLSSPVWSEDGANAVLIARSADNKDRWILALDPSTGKTRVVFTEHDDAWINSFGASALGWLGDNRRVYFLSERSGYSHLYTVPFDGGEPKQLTAGKWEVTGVQLSDDKQLFFLTTSEVGPGERHLYSMSVEGGERTKLTSMPGNNRAVVSPDEKTLALVYSYSNKPPELYVQENKPAVSALKVTSSPAPEFWTYSWIDPPIVTFPARDGAQVHARFYKPKNFRKGGPAVIFVHGAGYAQNVHRWWSSYYREYMFHHLLMENGYIVIDADYRASAGYGRDWRTAIYRHMGGKDLDDHVDAARWLVKEHGVDPNRIGIYGGSYGGFITLMAMFTQPDVFAAGAALRPVTDWAHYNHPYTSNILNLPQSDSEAYKKSSPIYFAQGLKGALLICHGMVDTNVHFQDTVRLVERLIELRKEGWELAVFPVENHGFQEPTSWADEYKRIFKLFETNLKSQSR
jgi:dipeptidyl aminopeptidase/acylaminoacyl peptidase